MSDLPSLLQSSREDLARFVAAHGGAALRFEGVDDLVQGVHLRALERGASFRYEGKEAFFAWLYAVARSYLADRKEHWSALKRRPASLARLTAAAGVAATATGPSTFAARREQLALAVKALALLLPRDRDLVRWVTEGLDASDMAKRLGVSREAADRARLRALERFRKAHRLLTGAGPR